ncbi:MAG: hypothetical protein K2M73_08025 [Lachnospiraceae bacterium]|nr:hypothetical protein [Lachnospiraceae bacterium]
MTTAIVLLYLAELCENIRVITILICAIMGVLWLFKSIDIDNFIFSPNALPWIKTISFKITFVLCLLIAVISPSKGLMYTITGFHIGGKLIEQPQMNSILDKSYKILDQKLDEILNNAITKKSD